jgi:K+-transporting ATPase ATPase A chain
VRGPADIGRGTSRGPPGLSGVLYAFTSAANNNNGSAFAGISADTPWYE